ncbi:MAG: rRNA pseudouridine synthase [Planctomycetes bacterium]|nr:rRNA pseudouridine synthase [Planctomycetota bacterium]
MIRLQKFLAQAGFGSRRQCEELILEGRITIDGNKVTELGTKVEPGRQTVYCDDEPVRQERPVYIIFNKPPGVICSNKDNTGGRRPRVIDFFPKVKQRLFPVGRLDVDSSGLLIVTNDGELCNMLTHPRYEVPKTYFVTVQGYVSPRSSEKIQNGIWLSEGKTGRSKLHIIKRAKDFSVVTITLREGKNREVRRIFANLGHDVINLVRVKIGSLSLGNLKPGEYRIVTREFLVHAMGIV